MMFALAATSQYSEISYLNINFIAKVEGDISPVLINSQKFVVEVSHNRL